MAYKLHELMKHVPGIAGEREGKPVTPHSPDVQRKLTLALDVQEGYTTEHGTPRSRRAEAQLAYDSYIEAEKAKDLGQVGLATEITLVD